LSASSSKAFTLSSWACNVFSKSSCLFIRDSTSSTVFYNINTINNNIEYLNVIFSIVINYNEDSIHCTGCRYLAMKRKSKPWWSTIPPISTTWLTTSNHWNTKKRRQHISAIS
jgi:hypothetical protein